MSVDNLAQWSIGCTNTQNNYPLSVNTYSGAVSMDIYKDGTVECTQLFIEPMLSNPVNNPTTKICMSSRNYAVVSPTTLTPDASITCTGGTLGTANKADLVISAGTISLNGNVKLPSTYTSAPADATYLGYLKEVKNTTALTMNATSATVLCSITLTAGVWIITGIACFFPTATSTFVQAAISSTCKCV